MLLTISIRKKEYIINTTEMPEISKESPLIIYYNIHDMTGGYYHCINIDDAESFYKKMSPTHRIIKITRYTAIEKKITQIVATKQKKIVWDAAESFLDKYSSYATLQ